MLESLEKKVSTFMFSDTEKNHFPLIYVLEYSILTNL